jgi:hypothetical protein
MNPSHVFLGLSWVSGVRPKSMPQKYADVSLQMTDAIGSRNLRGPRCSSAGSARTLPARVHGSVAVCVCVCADKVLTRSSPQTRSR